MLHIRAKCTHKPIYGAEGKHIGYTSGYTNRIDRTLHYADTYRFIRAGDDRYKIFARKISAKCNRVYERDAETSAGSSFRYNRLRYSIVQKIGAGAECTANIDKANTHYYIFTCSDTVRLEPRHVVSTIYSSVQHTKLRRFITNWESKGNYCTDGNTVVVSDLRRGSLICDFMALLLDPAGPADRTSPTDINWPAVRTYLYNRAHTRLITKCEFYMNGWQFVLIYLHDCHGLTFADMLAIYTHLPGDGRVPDFFRGAEHTTRQPGCVVCYVNKVNVVWHTEIVVDDDTDIGICANSRVVITAAGAGLADDIFYLDPVAVVAAIRQNIRTSAKNPPASIDIIDTGDYERIVWAIVNTDREIQTSIDAAVDKYAAGIPAGDGMQADCDHIPDWYTPALRECAVRRAIASTQRTSIQKDTVDRWIAGRV